MAEGAPVRLIIDQPAVMQLTRAPDGEVGRYLIQAGDELIELGYRQIDQRRSQWRGEHEGKLTILKRFGETGAGPVLIVEASSFSDPDYAYWVHEGNGPGPITSTTPGRPLAFVKSGARPGDKAGWKAARQEGRAIVVMSVKASQPNRFLSDNLSKVLDTGDEE